MDHSVILDRSRSATRRGSKEHGQSYPACRTHRRNLIQLAARTDATPYRCDAIVEADLLRFMEAIKRQFGKIDILILVAGYPAARSILTATAADLEVATSANYYCFFDLLKLGIPPPEDGGSVLVLTYLSASRVSPANPLYEAAKSAAANLVQYAAIEFAPSGIRVNGRSPGLIKTLMAAGRQENAGIR